MSNPASASVTPSTPDQRRRVPLWLLVLVTLAGTVAIHMFVPALPDAARALASSAGEMQLTIIWEEILKRFPEIKVVEEPIRTYSSFVKGYESMKVIIPARA